MRTARLFGGVVLFQCLGVVLAEAGQFAVRQVPDRLFITCEGQPVAEFVFKDGRILRPYFANLRAPGGYKVTRNHPPVAGQDATDHDTMHPGLWLAFGDINGQDFWRNKARIEHVRFAAAPKAAGGRLTFATECRLLATNGAPVCTVTSRLTLADLTNAWMLIWDATFLADSGGITFGDQEEMGFGVRIATGITEKDGGLITSSRGQKTANHTWGQSAEWCDCSGSVDGRQLGIMIMPDPANFRPSWWHNRDYGLMVANPFGRQAMKQGDRSAVTVRRGDSFRLRFGAAIHQGNGAQPVLLYESFLKDRRIE